MELSTSMRTHACGELRADDAGARVALCGWVAHRRDHGGVTFIDLRDRLGIVQLVFHPEAAPEAHAAAQDLRGESVIRATGVVRARPEGTVNPALPTGEIEVAVEGLEVLSEADTPPFPIEDRIDADELLRLKYRYLDLRRPEMTERLRVRHTVNRVTRAYLDARGFREVETPTLTRSTPEGARDFLVPSRTSRGAFYALPQSPQQLKQLLMVAGQDRYYQIVRCFRDEATRLDRTIEFTQLDVEMSFVEEEDLISLMEPLMVELLREVHGVEVATPFPRMTYDEMISRFGTDKPDLRYGMELADLSTILEGTEFRAFASALESGGAIKALAAPGGAQLSRKELDELVTETKGRGAAGLVWIAYEGGRFRSPVEKYLTGDELAEIAKATGAEDGDLILIVADNPAQDRRRARRAAAPARRPARPDPRGRVGVLLDARAAAVRVERGGGPLGLGPSSLHGSGDRGPQPGASQGARVRPGPERLRAGRGEHPNPPAGGAANGVRRARPRRRRDRGQVRPPAERVPLRRSPTRRHRPGI